MVVPVKIEPFFEDLLKETGHIDFSVLPVEEIRRLRGAAFTSEEGLPKVLEEDKMVQRQNGKTVEITITRPPNTENKVLPVIFYIHGGGWVNCNKNTHRKIRYELTDRTGGAVIFVSYSLSPEARYPYALEECYDALAWVTNPTNAASIKVDPKNIVVGGESAGGNLAAALCFLAKERGLLSHIKYQLLLYPTTNAEFNTESYDQFEKGYFLDRNLMKLYWDLYCPDKERQKEITASPLQASIEQLKGLPPACVLTCEADVLRDEGEAYGRKLQEAGVPVVSFRILGVIHGCFNTRILTPTSNAALDLVVSLVRKAWSSAPSATH